MSYFDNSATTPIDQDVQSLMSDLNLNIYGNPSSIYASGRNAKNTIEIARSCLLYTSPSPRDRQKSRMPAWA